MSEPNIVKRYWVSYGGFKAIFTSYFFYGAILLSALLYPHWSTTGWWDTVLSVMPNLLGFTLGGFAMWVAVGDENFKATIAGVSKDNPDDISPFMEVNATFAHFIFLQIFSIIFALINKAYDVALSQDHVLVLLFGSHLNVATLLFYYFSYFVFIYALLSAIASVLALFRVSHWYDDYQAQGTGQKIAAFLKGEALREELELRKARAIAQLQAQEVEETIN